MQASHPEGAKTPIAVPVSVHRLDSLVHTLAFNGNAALGNIPNDMRLPRGKRAVAFKPLWSGCVSAAL
jgi:hypothetical protein